jgi:hypothetical protein
VIGIIRWVARFDQRRHATLECPRLARGPAGIHSEPKYTGRQRVVRKFMIAALSDF